MRFRDLRPLAVPLIMLAAINGLWEPVIFGWAAASPDHFNANVAPNSNMIDDCRTALFILMVLLFIGWLYQAGRNLVAAGYDDLEFTPASRIWWFAVPVAALFVPFQARRELWNVSHGIFPHDRDHALLYGWWALHLIKSFAAVAFAFAVGSNSAFAAGQWWMTGTLDLAVAVPSILVVIGITRAQMRFRHPTLAEDFT